MNFFERLFQNKIVLSLLLVVGVGSLYFPSLNYGFIRFDDHKYITENIFVLNGLSWPGLKWAFLSLDAANWMPITWLSHMLDIQIWGLNAFLHRSVNLSFHAMNSVLIFLVFQRMTNRLMLSWFVALIFAIHPLHVESVIWISERKDVLSTFFMLLAFSNYTKIRLDPLNRSSLALTSLFFTLSVMSKPMYVTLPFLLILIDIWPLKRISKASEFWKCLLEKWPLILIALLAGTLTLLAQQRAGAVFKFEEIPFGYRIASIFIALSNYIQKFVFPDALSVFYLPFNEKEIQMWGSSSMLVLTGMTLIVMVGFKRKSQWVLVGWFIFLISLLPVLGFIKAGSQAMADRYTYFAYIGLSILLLWTGDSWMRLRPFMKYPLMIALSVWLVLCFGKTVQRVHDWENTEKLFLSAVEVDSKNYVAYKVLADNAYFGSDLKKSAHYLEQALAVLPIEAESMRLEYELNLAVVYHQSEEFELAATQYEKVTQRMPLRTDIMNALGDVYLKLNRKAMARLQYERALALMPGDENLQKKIAEIKSAVASDTSVSDA